jgi:hypothetical protein
MTTFQDQPPQSRRALREQQLNEHARTDDIDDSAEAARPAPSGRRAQRAEAPATLVEVPADGREPEHDRVEQEASADEHHTAETRIDGAEHVTDSAIATPFPFADQVEATSDDAGQPGFRLRDFSPELGAVRGESSTGEWTPPQISDPSAENRHDTGAASPISRRAQRAEAPAGAESRDSDGDAERPSFDSLFADLTLAESPDGADDAPDAAPEHAAESGSADESAAADAAAPAVDQTADATGDVPLPAADATGDVPVSAADASGDVPVTAADATGDVPVTAVDETGDVPVAADASRPLAESVPNDRPMSRREWRLMRARAEAEAAAAATTDAAPESPAEARPSGDDGRGIPALVEPTREVHTPLSDAMAEFEALTRSSEGRDPAAESSFPSFPAALAPGYAARTAPVTTTPRDETPAAVPFQAPELQHTDLPATASSPRENDTTSDNEPVVDVTRTGEPYDATARAAETADHVTADQATSTGESRKSAIDFAPRAGSAPAAAQSAPFSFLVTPPADATATPPADTADAPRDATTDTGSYIPPVGHWSRQAELDDENQPIENTLSRDVGGGNVATTTNALVLPMIPARDDFSSVLNATGEIMVTGTINLPGSVGATGRDSRHYDDPDVDHLFDAYDNEVANTDSAPVRAISAVSSHTASRGGIETGRKQSNRTLNVLFVTACVLAVGTVALLVAGFAFNFF